ncbi:ATS9 metalloproteinase, partial [Polypterus senegalus]
MTDTWGAPQVWYKISVFGRDFHLNLTADAGFIAPVYTVSILGAKNVTAFSAHEEDTDFKHCFYSGHVNSQKEHTAVISLCAGMLGTFRSPEGEFFVEPLHHHQGESFEEEHSKPHLVYRKDSSNEEESKKTSACETSGHNHSIQRSKENLTNHVFEDLDYLRTNIAAADAFSKKRDSNETSESGARRRSKRFLSYPRFVEVMVVADSKMVERHENNLQHYVLTLMSIVASIYRDPSIGNLIHIVIVKLVILKSEQVCLAELGTVCDPYRSCSISEDNGLSTAFTIAHELGHVFNMPHDDSNKCTEEGVKNQQHVMAPTLNYYTNPWMWSKCSRKYITEFLEPKNGGKYCVGRRMKFRSCNTEPCAKQKQDFREEQCAAFNGRRFSINNIPEEPRWVPKYSGILMKDRCKLFCRVAGKTMYYQLRDRVIDGTPCGPDTNDICVQGLCRQAGCDHVLNSKARRDKCGICGGDNSSCKTVAGTFNTVHYGYNVVIRIPVGATNIDVRQHSYSGKPEDDNYLAISNSRGEFLLNGEFIVSMFKREIKIGNAIIEYSGSDHEIERINCTDRLDEEITVQVLSVGNLYNPDVRYSFNIPIEDKPQQYFWDVYGPWQECSKLCQGERKRKILCSRESDRVVVSDQRCYGSQRPSAITEPCNTECELRWHIARRSECTAQCGPGYRTRELYCAKYSRSEGKTEKIDDRFCSSQRKPDDRECSKSCGGGTRRRGAVCVSSLGGVLDNSKCNQQDKLDIQQCNEFLCPQWKTGDWSECLVTCGKGYKHRQAWCQFGEDRLHDRFCDSSTKPHSVLTCQQQECAAWQVGPWGQCTTTCGPGYQMRAVKCVLGSYGSVVDDTECNAATRPTDTQCSATCGKGSRQRYVSCRDHQGGVADDSACSHLPKPPSREVCSVVACGQWKPLEWTLCSVTCGQGKATRQVVCISSNDQVVDLSECDPDDRPATVQECTMSACPSQSNDRGRINLPTDPRVKVPPSHGLPNRNAGRAQPPGANQWRMGPWGACSSTCAGGFQRRAVVCQDENGYAASNCEERGRPVEQRSCESGPCPQWVFGSWGECTKSCGGGVKTRQVVCQRSNGERFSDLSCEILDKPPDREQCNTQGCPSQAGWNSSPWSSCSVTCGRGLKYRTVTCLSKDGTQVDEERCHNVTKPSTQKQCRGGRCPKWKSGHWGPCSQSCGPGTRHRRVICQKHNGEDLSSEYCDSRKRPPETESCNVQPCEFIWITGEWSECSVSCGRGYQRRLVSCSEVYSDKDHYEYGYQVTSNCPGVPPTSIQACYPEECVAPATWRVANWERCSTTCGDGVMQRRVQCLDGSGQKSSECPVDMKPEESAVCHILDSTDWLFSQTSEGHHVPFATAGDCYSAAKCPQGRFSVDLSGTGFYITEETKWVSQGNYAVAEMKRSPLPAVDESESGQPCNVCGEQCPGFVLHKWRSSFANPCPGSNRAQGQCVTGSLSDVLFKEPQIEYTRSEMQVQLPFGSNLAEPPSENLKTYTLLVVQFAVGELEACHDEMQMWKIRRAFWGAVMSFRTRATEHTGVERRTF